MNRILAYQGKIVLVLAALMLASGVSWAASPHFVGPVPATLVEGNALQVCWKEAGLGNNQLIDYTASANATATFVCVNNGGQCPNAANKQQVQGPVSATGTFDSGDNGQITQCLIIQPPSVTPFCPGGQTETLDFLSYSGIKISDDTNDVTKTATPSSITVDPFDCP